MPQHIDSWATWRFPNMGVPKKSILLWFSILNYKPSILGYSTPNVWTPPRVFLADADHADCSAVALTSEGSVAPWQQTMLLLLPTRNDVVINSNEASGWCLTCMSKRCMVHKNQHDFFSWFDLTNSELCWPFTRSQDRSTPNPRIKPPRHKRFGETD